MSDIFDELAQQHTDVATDIAQAEKDKLDEQSDEAKDDEPQDVATAVPTISIPGVSIR